MEKIDNIGGNINSLSNADIIINKFRKSIYVTIFGILSGCSSTPEIPAISNNLSKPIISSIDNVDKNTSGLYEIEKLLLKKINLHKDDKLDLSSVKISKNLKKEDVENIKNILKLVKDIFVKSGKGIGITKIMIDDLFNKKINTVGGLEIMDSFQWQMEFNSLNELGHTGCGIDGSERIQVYFSDNLYKFISIIIHELIHNINCDNDIYYKDILFLEEIITEKLTRTIILDYLGKDNTIVLGKDNKIELIGLREGGFGYQIYFSGLPFFNKILYIFEYFNIYEEYIQGRYNAIPNIEKLFGEDMIISLYKLHILLVNRGVKVNGINNKKFTSDYFYKLNLEKYNLRLNYIIKKIKEYKKNSITK